MIVMMHFTSELCTIFTYILLSAASTKNLDFLFVGKCQNVTKNKPLKKRSSRVVEEALFSRVAISTFNCTLQRFS